MAKTKRLSEYEQKRDFATTPEPAPATEDAAEGGRFVVQEHHARRLHWDLRLERDGVLASWAVPNGIPDDPKRNRKAVRTEDHPLEYLEFEGEIPEGQYGAGTMSIWDRGTYDCEKFRDDEVIVVFHGERVTGRYALFRAGRDPKDWMIHRMDPAEPGRAPMAERVAPMLARLGKLPRDETGWGFEVKWDGVRAIAFGEPGRLRLQSRNLKEITERYPEVRGLREALGSRAAILDGEIVAFDEDGRPSFERLQQRMHVVSEARVRRLASALPVVYVIFDLLYLDGEDLMGLPYEQRRKRLEALELGGPAWQTPAYHRQDGAALLDATRDQGLEGVVAKRLDSQYEPGRRSSGWIKVKNVHREDFVIGGWMPGEGNRVERIGALLVGEREADGTLRYAGRVGTGFTAEMLDDLARRLAPLRRKDSPFAKGRVPKGARFVEPRLTAQVEYRERTQAGVLRAPSFKGLRDDPALSDGQVEVEGRALKLSNRDKVLYPKTGFTKGDVIDYYVAVAPVLLPHLRGRPLTLKRYPDGVEGEYFYEKQCPSHRPEWVRTAPVETGRKTIDFCVADDLPTLVWLANLADLELHTSLATAEDVTRPTMLMFDLDPGPGMGILDCAEVALWLRDVFESLKLRTFVKTSGSKGLHAQVPLNSEVTYEQTKPFARAVAELMAKHHGERVVSRMTKRLREGRVLVDWSQNDEHKTTVCAYSLRARERPTVSTPLEWDEVEAALETGDEAALVFEAPAVVERVRERGDPLAEALTLRQELPDLGSQS
jgi:bifunctional non-homologous end joining protein LigD